MQVAFSSWVTLHSTFLFGDVIELKNGTKLQGKVTKGELGNTPSDIEITFEDGVIVEIPSSQIAKIVPPREIELKYAKNIEKFADDKAGNEKLIDLCNSNDLQALTLAHRERLLEHNPDDGKARAALRYINSPKDGWILEEKYWAQLGMKKDAKNKWKFPEEIAIQEKKQQQKEAEAAAGKQLILWMNDVNSGNKRAETSLAQLRDIKDPVYLPRIQEILLGDKFNASLQVRLMLVDALGRIGTRGAIYVLCDVYLRENQNQIRDQALDGILRLQSPIATAYLISKLSNRNPQNDSIQVINRAGMALGAIGDTRAFPAMIDALITKHITIQAPGPDTNVGTDSTGNVNFAQGGNKPKVIQNTSQNKDVLSGLRQMAGDVNFDFDQGSWARMVCHATSVDSLEFTPRSISVRYTCLAMNEWWVMKKWGHVSGKFVKSICSTSNSCQTARQSTLPQPFRVETFKLQRKRLAQLQCEKLRTVYLGASLFFSRSIRSILATSAM